MRKPEDLGNQSPPVWSECGDTNPGTAGIALVPAQLLTSLLELAGQVQEETEKKEDGQ